MEWQHVCAHCASSESEVWHVEFEGGPALAVQHAAKAGDLAAPSCSTFRFTMRDDRRKRESTKRATREACVSSSLMTTAIAREPLDASGASRPRDIRRPQRA